jgi:Mg-chelatase subunit ChlD
VTSLKSADFRGKDATVTSVSQGKTARVVILLDTSKSMAAKDWVVKSIVDELMRSSPQGVQYALVGFSSRVSETVEFGRSGSEVLSALDRLTKSFGEGKTAIRDSELYASDLFGQPQAGDSILVLSDGEDTGSKTNMAAVRQAYWSRGIRMFFFELVDRYPVDQTQTAVEQELFSEDTGGGYYKIDGPTGDQIPTAIRAVQDELSNYYLLRLGLVESAQKTTSMHLELVDSSGRRRKDVTLAFPARISPTRDCSP